MNQKISIQSLVVSLVLLSLVLAGLIVLRTAVAFPPDTLQQATGVLLAVVMIGSANYLPKLVDPIGDRTLEEVGSPSGRRKASYILVLTGLALLVVWLAAPSYGTIVTASLAPIGFLLSLVVGVRASLPSFTASVPNMEEPATAIRMALLLLLLGVLSVCCLIAVDLLWGDLITQTAVVVLASAALPMTVAFAMAYRAVRSRP